MVHFFNKNEMILLALMISLLDINNLCSYAIPHIIYPNKRNYLVYFIVLFTLVLDVYMYYSQINESVSPSYPYGVDINNSATGCNAYTKSLNAQINEWNNICSQETTKFQLTTTRVMLIVLAFFIIGISLVCLAVNRDGTNPTYFKIIFTIPLLIIAICLIGVCFIDVKKLFVDKK